MWSGNRSCGPGFELGTWRGGRLRIGTVVVVGYSHGARGVLGQVLSRTGWRIERAMPAAVAVAGESSRWLVASAVRVIAVAVR
jgi:hypothetical protein